MNDSGTQHHRMVQRGAMGRIPPDRTRSRHFTRARRIGHDDVIVPVSKAGREIQDYLRQLSEGRKTSRPQSRNIIAVHALKICPRLS